MARSMSNREGNTGAKKTVPKMDNFLANTAAQALKAASTPAQLARMGYKIVAMPLTKPKKK